MGALDKRLEALLQDRKAKNRFRSLKEYNTSTSSELVDFSSNDYLSLTSSSELRQEYLKRLAASPHILGSTGSRLLSGGTSAHSALESRFSSFFDSPAALLFNSGWDANVSFFGTVPQSSDWVVYDELVHASVHSGMRASRVRPERRIPFRHNDPDALREVLLRIRRKEDAGPSSSTKQEGVIFLALESLYSMDGDLACLPAFLDVMDEVVPRDRQCVVLDEAHSTGVYGSGGRGVGHAIGEAGDGRVGVRLMTFGKAVGSSGAVLLCSPVIRSFLINFARPLIFSTAIPHSTLISLECAWDLLQSTDGDQRRDKLMSLSSNFHALVRPILARTPRSTLSLPPAAAAPFASARQRHPTLPADPFSPIIGLLTPRPHALSAFLLERGLVVRPVVPPTVPPGGERVRICLRADMGMEVVERLVKALEAWADQERAGGVGRGTAGVQQVQLRGRL
ncbi:putative 8-amino-7-oxononanoatesynthase [Dioszegia hungarica]|uniref:8-amino-7-oxononanoatesynthase n=1 Tax=Dioszegia hungarica TaxID=4972 RepID=A0AA38HH49_9TREE|nr:putative 8-amino-7-oxononanoatesynthase [Dioszegia hungarica]KAI9639506.1 putative 8-amino-7-oxononanoatesynthase [Dioszegia hungarica]